MTCTSSGIGCSTQLHHGCVDQFGCHHHHGCPDFIIRRHDNKPAFKVKIEDSDGPMDFTNLILEASMWAKGRLKKHLKPEDTYFSFADNIGFNQLMVGDIIVMDRPRLPEKMLVVGFDEDDHLVLVQRGYHGTTAQNWKRGTHFRIMKFINAPAQTEMIYQDHIKMDGTAEENMLVDSFLVYEWGPNDTCLAGCYYLEFKLIKMIGTVQEPDYVHEHESRHSRCPYPGGTVYGPLGPFVPDGDTYERGVYDVPGPFDPNPPHRRHHHHHPDEIIIFSPSVINIIPSVITLPDVVPVGDSIRTNCDIIPSNCSNISFIGSDCGFVIPTFTSPSDIPSTFGCGLPSGVEWVRRFPSSNEGFLIRIFDSPSGEM